MKKAKMPTWFAWLIFIGVGVAAVAMPWPEKDPFPPTKETTKDTLTAPPIIVPPADIQGT